MKPRNRLAHAVRTASVVGLASVLSALAAGVIAEEKDIDVPVDSYTGGAALEELVVTARRRDENAQDVPIALSVVNEGALAATGAYSLNEIQRLVPSLQVFSFNPRNTNVNIRGLGSNVSLTNDGLENGVGFYIDNVYYGRVGQTQFDLVDLQQVEVLRGPQGTLFGKNTTAGAINISTRRPSYEPEYSGELSVGDYGRREVRASASGPIVDDKAAYRVTYAHTVRDGILENVHSGRKVSDYDNTSVRAQLLFDPGEDLQIRLIGDYSAQNAECCIQPLADVFTHYDNGARIPNNFYDRVGRQGYEPLPPDAFARKVDIDAPISADMNSYGVSGQVDWELGAGTLTSITAYRGWDWNPANDADGTPLSVFTLAQQENRQRQFSQELRFASQESEVLDYVVGAYYLWQRNEGISNIAYGADAADWFLPTVPAVVGEAALSGFGYETESAPEIDSYAAFGQTVWHITPRLDLTTGLRFTREEKEGEFETYWVSGADLTALPPALATGAAAIRNGFNPQYREFTTGLNDNSVSGLVSLSYALSDTVLAYATYSQGAKSGGLNLAILPAGVDPVVEPEDVENYEAGLKTQLLDGRLTLNTAIFQTEISDYQTAITEVLETTTAIRQYVANTGEVRSRGAEADLAFQASDLVSFNASVSYNDATYLDYENAQQAPENLNLGAIQDLSGEPLPGAPEWTYTLGADIAYPVAWGDRALEVYGNANYAYRTEYFTAISNSRHSEVDAHGILTARVGVRTEDARWDLSLWAKNLTDEEYFQTLSPGNTGSVGGVVGEPRYVGVTVRTNF